jgi:hypothetical protein
MYDVNDISKILRVSNRTVYRYLSKYSDKLSHRLSEGDNGKKLLDQEGLEILARLTNKNIDVKDKSTRNAIADERESEYITLLKEQVQELKQDKERLHKQVDELTRLLDQQQQLTLIGSPGENGKTDNGNENSTKDNENKNSFFSKIKNLFK